MAVSEELWNGSRECGSLLTERTEVGMGSGYGGEELLEVEHRSKHVLAWWGKGSLNRSFPSHRDETRLWQSTSFF